MDIVNLQALYDSDPRLTFVVDCYGKTATICHFNKALCENLQVAQSLKDGKAPVFEQWWHPYSQDIALRSQEEFIFRGRHWIKFTACERWLIVTSTGIAPPSKLQDSPVDFPPLTKTPSSRHRQSIFTVEIQSAELRQHIDYIRQVNWGATSLGPLETWDHELLHLVTLMMLETRPTALFLGPDSTTIYNLPYAKVSGNRHPRMFGQNVVEAWPELKEAVEGVIERTRKSSFADLPEEEYHHMIQRNGYLEETFFLWSLVPLVGTSVDGMYSIVTETTKQRLLERRVNAVLRLGELTGSAIELDAFWASILKGMKPYEYDFPLAILYSTQEPDTSSSAGSGRSRPILCSLEGTIGYADDHPDVPKVLDLESNHGLARLLADCANRGVPILARIEDGLVQKPLYHDIQERGFGDPCKAFIACPIQPASKKTISGFLIVGLNTRRPYDLEYREWITIVTKLLGSTAASVVLYEEELRSRQRAVEQEARDRAILKDELALVMQEANDTSRRLNIFHSVANSIGVGWFEYKMDGRLVNANDAFFAQSGHPRDTSNLPEFSFSQLIYPPDLEMVMEKWHTLASGQSVTFEMRWKRALTEEAMLEGDTRDYLWTLSACMPVKAADGTVIGISGSNADISAQKESTQVAFQRAIALERARASEVRLNNYTQISPVAICRLDSDLNMQYCNPKWFEITGHPIVPIDNVQWSPVIVDEDLEKVRKEIGKIKDIKDPRTFFFRTKKIWTSPDGVETPTWVLATGTVEEDDAGNVISILATMTDVSQLRWAEDIQKVRVEEALESKRQQENFIDMTSHEMRNPLSAMVQCADSVATSLAELREVTQDDVLTNHPTLMSKIKDLLDSSVDALVTIQACATHQKRIVDDILTLSKLDSKLLNISPITIQTSALLQDTYRMFKDEAHKAGVELAVHTEPSIQKLNIDWAILDPSRVLQVLINLITNAIKFTQDQSTRKVDISMGASLDVNRKPGVQYVQQEAIREDFPDQRKSDGGKVFYLHFTVRDTGCGLTAEHKAKLFMRFSQATPRTHIQYGGSGLGLFISRELTEMQGGSIGVESTQSLGSTFTFYVRSRKAMPPSPVATPLPLRPAANVTSTRALSIPQPVPQSPTTTSNLHILVVEDNLINQRVLSNQLRKLGHTVHVAGHGGEALDQLRKTTYHRSPSVSPPLPLSVVLMDVEMPVMDGLTCTRRIREMEASSEIVAHVPIIAVSANARREQVEQARSAGMDDAISKPFRIPELIPKIWMLVG